MVVHEHVLMKITGDHPHKGELCNPIGKTPETLTKHYIFGKAQFLVKLIDCKHGMDQCYVPQEQLSLLQVGDETLW
jgi:hypothetical protein